MEIAVFQEVNESSDFIPIWVGVHTKYVESMYQF